MSGPALKVCEWIPDDIGGAACSPKRLVDAWPIQAPGCLIWQDYAEIQVAVGTSIAPRLGTEKVDSHGPVVFDQAARDLFDGFPFSTFCLHHAKISNSEVIAVQKLPTPWRATPPRGCFNYAALFP